MAYTLGEAAKATGISKASISRAINSGRISAIKKDDGSFSIEPVELHRVYPPKSAAPVTETPSETLRNGNADTRNGSDSNVLQARLDAALEQLRDRDGTIDDLRRRLDQSDEERREAQARVIGLLAGTGPTESIAGLEDTLGRNGVTSNYLYDLAPYTHRLVQEMTSGRALFSQPPMPIKCAGAPQKAMYLSCDIWRRAGLLPGIDVEFHNAGAVLFGVSTYVPALMDYIARYGIDLRLESNLVAVDGARRVATFECKRDGRTETIERAFDMLHVVPPHVSHDWVAKSPLAAPSGFIDVDEATLRHKRYDRHAIRDAHAKSHAVLRGTLTVHDDLAPELRQGIFGHPCTYGVVARLSSAPSDIHSDAIPAPRGFAIKVIGVEGERLSPDIGGANQDFLMVNFPVLAFGTIAKYKLMLSLLEANAHAPDTFQRLIAGTARGAKKTVEALGMTPGATLEGLARDNHHPLGESYHTQGAIRFGDHVAKLALSPASDNVRALTGQPVGKADFSTMRDVMVEHFAGQGAEYALSAQLCTDLAEMPVEDAAVRWDEKVSPHRPIATLRFAAQDAYAPARQVYGRQAGPRGRRKSSRHVVRPGRGKVPDVEGPSAPWKRARRGSRLSRPHSPEECSS